MARLVAFGLQEEMIMNRGHAATLLRWLLMEFRSRREVNELFFTIADARAVIGTNAQGVHSVMYLLRSKGYNIERRREHGDYRMIRPYTLVLPHNSLIPSIKPETATDKQVRAARRVREAARNAANQPREFTELHVVNETQSVLRDQSTGNVYIATLVQLHV